MSVEGWAGGLGAACDTPRAIGIESGCDGCTVTVSEPQGWSRWVSWEEVIVPTVLQRHFGQAEVVVSGSGERKLGWHRLQKERKTRTGRQE